jgi:uncharacterized protein YbjT (DUF2867 family)
MNIAIFGAAGAIGPVAARELQRRGHTLRLVGRSRAKLEALDIPGAEIVTADLADPVAARRAANGSDAILDTVGLP